jgi:hypothetical protein
MLRSMKWRNWGVEWKKGFLQTAQTATNAGWARAERNKLFYKYFNHCSPPAAAKPSLPPTIPTYLPTYCINLPACLPACLPHQPESNSIVEPPVPVLWTNQTPPEP